MASPLIEMPWKGILSGKCVIANIATDNISSRINQTAILLMSTSVGSMLKSCITSNARHVEWWTSPLSQMRFELKNWWKKSVAIKTPFWDKFWRLIILPRTPPRWFNWSGVHHPFPLPSFIISFIIIFIVWELWQVIIGSLTDAALLSNGWWCCCR